MGIIFAESSSLMPDRCFSHPFFKTSSDRDYGTKHQINENTSFLKDSLFQQHISVQCHIEIRSGSADTTRCAKRLPSCPRLHGGSQSYTSLSPASKGVLPWVHPAAKQPFPQRCGFLWGVPTEQRLLPVFVGTFLQSPALTALFHGAEQFGACPETRSSRVRTCSAALAPAWETRELGAKGRAEASALGNRSDEVSKPQSSPVLLRVLSPQARAGERSSREGWGKSGVGRSTGAAGRGGRAPECLATALVVSWSALRAVAYTGSMTAGLEREQNRPRSPRLPCAPASRSSP